MVSADLSLLSQLYEGWRTNNRNRFFTRYDKCGIHEFYIRDLSSIGIFIMVKTIMSKPDRREGK